MSIKKTRVRAKDLKQGRTIYVMHPTLGMEVLRITSKPYSKKDGSLVVNHGTIYSSTDYSFLSDIGVVPYARGLGYINHRRAFFKEKQALAYRDAALKDPAFIKWNEFREEQLRLDR